MIVERPDDERLARAKKAYTTHSVRWADAAPLVGGDASVGIGDLVLARVDEIGHHEFIELPTGRRARMHPGDEIVVCYGNRCAPDQIEAEAPATLEPCDRAAAGGVASRVLGFHQRMRPPTRLTSRGLIADRDGKPLNLAR